MFSKKATRLVQIGLLITFVFITFKLTVLRTDTSEVSQQRTSNSFEQPKEIIREKVIIKPQIQIVDSREHELKQINGEDYVKQKGALVALVRNSDLGGMRKAIRQVEDRFNKKYKYPYIFLNDVPFTDEFKKGIESLTDAKVEFGQLDKEAWGYPEWIDHEKKQALWDNSTYMHGKSESYRFMCRFQSGFVFRHPLLKDLEYYWRIEPDVEYFCDIDYDPFYFMKKNNKAYGFNIAFGEYMETIPTLYETTKKFMEQYPQHVNRNNLRELVEENGNYNGCHFWSNFEIVDLSFYRSQKYLDYFNFLDKAGGFFYERWGDAPVHTLAAALLLDRSQVHYFEDIGYYHPAIGHCPANSERIGKCVCDSKKHSVGNHSCAKNFKKLVGL